jgi:hypothetical protein
MPSLDVFRSHEPLKLKSSGKRLAADGSAVVCLKPECMAIISISFYDRSGYRILAHFHEIADEIIFKFRKTCNYFPKYDWWYLGIWKIEEGMHKQPCAIREHLVYVDTTLRGIIPCRGLARVSAFRKVKHKPVAVIVMAA